MVSDRNGKRANVYGIRGQLVVLAVRPFQLGIALLVRVILIYLISMPFYDRMILYQQNLGRDALQR